MIPLYSLVRAYNDTDGTNWIWVYLGRNASGRTTIYCTELNAKCSPDRTFCIRGFWPDPSFVVIGYDKRQADCAIYNEKNHPLNDYGN